MYMVIKSLTITENAYDMLKRLKHGDESFSEVIIRISKDKIGATSRFLGALKITDDENEKWKKNIKDSRKAVELDFVMRAKKIRRIL